MTLKTERTRVRRIPERGHYDKEIIYPIIDEALYCHVGINHNGSPVVIPTIHARTNKHYTSMDPPPAVYSNPYPVKIIFVSPSL